MVDFPIFAHGTKARSSRPHRAPSRTAMPAAAQGDVASPPAVAESRPGDDGGHHWSPRKIGDFHQGTWVIYGDLVRKWEKTCVCFFLGGMI